MRHRLGLVPILSLVACAQAGERPHASGPTAASGCPAEGAAVPFAQLTTQADRFVGCEVTTEAEFVGTGTGPGYFMFNTKEQTVFRVVPPGQASSAGVLGDSFVAVGDALAGPVFSAHTGQRVALRGQIEYRKMAWVDQGNYSRLFRATEIKLEK